MKAENLTLAEYKSFVYLFQHYIRQKPYFLPRGISKRRLHSLLYTS